MSPELESGQVSPIVTKREVTRLASLRRVHDAFAWFRAHDREIAEFQMRLTSVPSPPFHEQDRSDWYREELRKLGFLPVEQDDIGNVFAVFPGTNSDAPLLAVSAHLDTVFPPDVPIQVKREYNRLFGPGISDNGAGLTALWSVASALRHCGFQLKTPVLFLANVGEEGEGDLRGFRYVFTQDHWRSRISQVLVLDGAGVDTIVAQALGSRRFEVRVSGPGGHSWSDFGAPNPIVALGRAIAALGELDLPLDPKTTLNIGTIEGGTSVNTIPESAAMRVDVRSAATSEIDRLEDDLRETVAAAVAETQREARESKKKLTLSIDVVGNRPAAELRSDAPIMAVLRAVDEHLGIRSHIHRASTDANIPLSLGIDAAAIGAGGTGGGAHTLHEWYDPAGRDRALKRILLVILALAGVNEP